MKCVAAIILCVAVGAIDGLPTHDHGHSNGSGNKGNRGSRLERVGNIKDDSTFTNRDSHQQLTRQHDGEHSSRHTGTWNHDGSTYSQRDTDKRKFEDAEDTASQNRHSLTIGKEGRQSITSGKFEDQKHTTGEYEAQRSNRHGHDGSTYSQRDSDKRKFEETEAIGLQQKKESLIRGNEGIQKTRSTRKFGDLKHTKGEYERQHSFRHDHDGNIHRDSDKRKFEETEAIALRQKKQTTIIGKEGPQRRTLRRKSGDRRSKSEEIGTQHSSRDDENQHGLRKYSRDVKLSDEHSHKRRQELSYDQKSFDSKSFGLDGLTRRQRSSSLRNEESDKEFRRHQRQITGSDNRRSRGVPNQGTYETPANNKNANNRNNNGNHERLIRKNLSDYPDSSTKTKGYINRTFKHVPNSRQYLRGRRQRTNQNNDNGNRDKQRQSIDSLKSKQGDKNHKIDFSKYLSGTQFQDKEQLSGVLYQGPTDDFIRKIGNLKKNGPDTDANKIRYAPGNLDQATDSNYDLKQVINQKLKKDDSISGIGNLEETGPGTDTGADKIRYISRPVDQGTDSNYDLNRVINQKLKKDDSISGIGNLEEIGPGTDTGADKIRYISRPVDQGTDSNYDLNRVINQKLKKDDSISGIGNLEEIGPGTDTGADKIRYISRPVDQATDSNNDLNLNQDNIYDYYSIIQNGKTILVDRATLLNIINKSGDDNGNIDSIFINNKKGLGNDGSDLTDDTTDGTTKSKITIKEKTTKFKHTDTGSDGDNQDNTSRPGNDDGYGPEECDDNEKAKNIESDVNKINVTKIINNHGDENNKDKSSKGNDADYTANPSLPTIIKNDGYNAPDDDLNSYALRTSRDRYRYLDTQRVKPSYGDYKYFDIGRGRSIPGSDGSTTTIFGDGQADYDSKVTPDDVVPGYIGDNTDKTYNIEPSNDNIDGTSTDASETDINQDSLVENTYGSDEIFKKDVLKNNNDNTGFDDTTGGFNTFREFIGSDGRLVPTNDGYYRIVRNGKTILIDRATLLNIINKSGDDNGDIDSIFINNKNGLGNDGSDLTDDTTDGTTKGKIIIKEKTTKFKNTYTGSDGDNQDNNFKDNTSGPGNDDGYGSENNEKAKNIESDVNKINVTKIINNNGDDNNRDKGSKGNDATDYTANPSSPTIINNDGYNAPDDDLNSYALRTSNDRYRYLDTRRVKPSYGHYKYFDIGRGRSIPESDGSTTTIFGDGQADYDSKVTPDDVVPGYIGDNTDKTYNIVPSNDNIDGTSSDASETDINQDSLVKNAYGSDEIFKKDVLNNNNDNTGFDNANGAFIDTLGEFSSNDNVDGTSTDASGTDINQDSLVKNTYGSDEIFKKDVLKNNNDNTGFDDTTGGFNTFREFIGSDGRLVPTNDGYYRIVRNGKTILIDRATLLNIINKSGDDNGDIDSIFINNKNGLGNDGSDLTDDTTDGTTKGKITIKEKTTKFKNTDTGSDGDNQDNTFKDTSGSGNDDGYGPEECDDSENAKNIKTDGTKINVTEIINNNEDDGKNDNDSNLRAQRPIRHRYGYLSTPRVKPSYRYKNINYGIGRGGSVPGSDGSTTARFGDRQADYYRKVIFVNRPRPRYIGDNADKTPSLTGQSLTSNNNDGIVPFDDNIDRTGTDISGTDQNNDNSGFYYGTSNEFTGIDDDSYLTDDTDDETSKGKITINTSRYGNGAYDSEDCQDDGKGIEPDVNKNPNRDGTNDGKTGKLLTVTNTAFKYGDGSYVTDKDGTDKDTKITHSSDQDASNIKSIVNNSTYNILNKNKDNNDKTNDASATIKTLGNISRLAEILITIKQFKSKKSKLDSDDADSNNVPRCVEYTDSGKPSTDDGNGDYSQGNNNSGTTDNISTDDCEENSTNKSSDDQSKNYNNNISKKRTEISKQGKLVEDASGSQTESSTKSGYITAYNKRSNNAKYTKKTKFTKDIEYSKTTVIQNKKTNLENGNKSSPDDDDDCTEGNGPDGPTESRNGNS